MCIITTFFSGAFAISSGTEGEEVVLVTAVSGDVRVSSGEEAEERPLKTGMRLQVGEEVVVHTGNASLVFFAGSYIKLAAGERLLLGESLAESMLQSGGTTRGLTGEDALPVLEQGLERSKKNDVWQAQLASVSGIRGDGLPVAVAPRLTIASENPRFYWFDTDTSGTGAERRYILLLRAEDGTVLARQELQGRTGRLNTFRFAQLPDGFTASPRMHYEWSVLPAGAVEPEGRLDASFVFVDHEGMELARNRSTRLQDLEQEGHIEEMTLHILHCELYLDERERLFSDALPHLLVLAGTEEGKDYASSRIARMFLRFGNQVSSLAPLFHDRPAAYLDRTVVTGQ
ncbi:MAG: hypothetical protein KFH87_12345 [Bacteroidetes bacterium]|nr:hypothetical protein [Bacteroidota bacterium]